MRFNPKQNIFFRCLFELTDAILFRIIHFLNTERTNKEHWRNCLIEIGPVVWGGSFGERGCGIYVNHCRNIYNDLLEAR
jgi:hypothetical protein